MIQKFDALIDGYVQDGVGIIPSFISPELTNALRSNLELLHMQGNLSPAGIGKGVSKVYDMQVRSDKIYWIERTSESEAEHRFLDLVDEFVAHLNRTCYTGINDYEFHYAIYEEGSFYKRHLDQFRSSPGRKFTFITYLNDDWKDEDGGHLVIYPGEKTQAILPVGGTSVFFKSDELEHEVTPANRARMSIAGWLKRV